ncbi:EngC GTPase [Legionella busanensis]|uniref:Small ribosomal subunit biogenesis GTPase RsgA n=1 Tax=Legionella busanensis TaxID=190655 RepID=A0A378JND2_9GAMM|nr:ribosome small subunit-dependent GTPase A [Legionella busanensis]STX52587.1 EngC GTPase [Legionella busanensis]
MGKRRLNKQQTARVQRIQASYQQPHIDSSNHEDGLIISRFSRHAEVEDNKGKRFHCSIRPNIDSLVAGDRVVWQSTGIDQGVVLSRYPRKTILTRTDKRDEHKPIAANISQVFIVVAPKPAISWMLLDSYLVMAENLQLQVQIVLNKVDLSCLSLRQELINHYQPLGYNLLFTSKEDLNSYLILQQALRDHVNVFVGQSGVGKSSLIEKILPHEKIQVAAISELSELGCHTTSNSRFYHLPQGGALIDSPGVRDFSLSNISAAEAIHGFREFRELASHCKFRNCNHRDNPGCALIDAVKQGHVSLSRYENLLKIKAQLALQNY